MGRRLRAYGFCVAAPGLDLPGERDAAGDAPDLVIALGDPVAAFSGPCVPPRVAQRRAEGLAARYERGADGDVLITWEGGGTFRIGPHAHEVLATGAPGPQWKRFLLDSVLATAALVAGREALHAGAVEVDGGAVLIAAGEGGGKTTLVSALLAAGARLVADDVCVLLDGPVLAPGPPVLNLAHDAPVDPRAVGTELDCPGTAERWMLAARSAHGPVAPRAVVLLERSPGAATGTEELDRSPLPLLPLFLESGDERRRARFEAAAALAKATPIVRLSTGLKTPPDRSIETLRPWVGALPPRAPRYFTG